LENKVKSPFLIQSAEQKEFLDADIKKVEIIVKILTKICHNHGPCVVNLFTGVINSVPW